MPMNDYRITVEVGWARRRNRPKKTWKDVVDKDVRDLHLKPSDL